jgi:hypothetical protein
MADLTKIAEELLKVTNDQKLIAYLNDYIEFMRTFQTDL